MDILTQAQGYWFLIIFGLAMIVITYYFSRSTQAQTSDGFLVANRNLSWWVGGPSIAASWIWAGALFVSIQMAYQQGLAGIFWFTFPNILALAFFAIWAPRIREKFPEGYTLPQFIKEKFENTKLHKLYLVPFFFNQILAITFNIFAGGSMIALLTGIPLVVIMPILAVIALLYTLISGLRASVITDFIQVALILIGIIVIVPLTIAAAGGLQALVPGLGGPTGEYLNILHPGVLFSLGLMNSIGLISGAIADQQYWQRAFAIKKEDVKKAFLFGAFLFALVPIFLSFLGFLAANPALGVELANTDPSLIGLLTVGQLLPYGVTLLFATIMLAGLSSTIDSGISAATSLWVTDVKGEAGVAGVKKVRVVMFWVTIIGVLAALGAYLIPTIGISHLFFLSISMVASISVPTILSIYRENINPDVLFWGILIAIVIGMPTFFYANIIGNLNLQAGAAVFMLAVSTISCFIKTK